MTAMTGLFALISLSVWTGMSQSIVTIIIIIIIIIYYYYYYLLLLLLLLLLIYIRYTSVIAIDFLTQHPIPNHGLWEAKRVST